MQRAAAAAVFGNTVAPIVTAEGTPAGDTPRTDEEAELRGGSFLVRADFARMLERELTALQAALDRVTKKSDAEMERVKACEHIAEGDEGWERLRNECPSTAAVAALRDRAESAERRAAELEADAERYRWMREHTKYNLDATIDARLALSDKQKEG